MSSGQQESEGFSNLSFLKASFSETNRLKSREGLLESSLTPSLYPSPYTGTKCRAKAPAISGTACLSPLNEEMPCLVLLHDCSQTCLQKDFQFLASSCAI